MHDEIAEALSAELDDVCARNAALQEEIRRAWMSTQMYKTRAMMAERDRDAWRSRAMLMMGPMTTCEEKIATAMMADTRDARLKALAWIAGIASPENEAFESLWKRLILHVHSDKRNGDAVKNNHRAVVDESTMEAVCRVALEMKPTRVAE